MKTIVNKQIDLRDRTLAFSKDIIRFCKPLERSLISRSVIDQLIRSSTSIGANFIEAKNSGSKRDFRNKVLISKKEASETLYWLKITEEFVNNEQLQNLQRECQEIILILQSIINTLNA